MEFSGTIEGLEERLAGMERRLDLLIQQGSSVPLPSSVSTGRGRRQVSCSLRCVVY